MAYATRGGGPASSINQLQDPGQYYGDKERRLLKSQMPPGKARGKGKATGPSQTRGPDYRTKPVANDLLKQLLAEPGGIKQMSDAAQYGRLVDMRQKQAMLDRSEGAMREMQRLTQSMTAAQAAGVRAGQRPAGVSETVRRAVENVQARQRRDLETAGAQVQGRFKSLAWARRDGQVCAGWFALSWCGSHHCRRPTNHRTRLGPRQNGG